MNTEKCVWLYLLIGALVWNCTTTPILERGPLSELVLRPRSEYPGKLTNKRCNERKKNSSECLTFDVKIIDLSQKDQRDMLRNLRFVCNVRGERFGICPDHAGLCQLTKDRYGIWPFRKEKVVLRKYLSLDSDLELLIASNAYCASFDSDLGQSMFP